MAIAAARDGCDVLVVELEGHSSLGPLLGVDGLSYEAREIAMAGGPVDDGAGRLRASQLRPDDALSDYLDRAGLGPVAGRLTRTGAMDVVVTAAPGIRDLLTLGKIRQLEQAGAADLIIVDAPAAGHALTFLTAPAGLADSTNAGPIREQADQVLELFADDTRCQVMLVTLPEETPVTETIETAFSLEDEVGIKLAPVVVNACWPRIDGLAAAVAEAPPGRESAVEAARYRLARIEDQQGEIDRLAEELPLPQLHLPYLFRADLGPDELVELADAVTAQAGALDSQIAAKP